MTLHYSFFSLPQKAPLRQTLKLVHSNLISYRVTTLKLDNPVSENITPNNLNFLRFSIYQYHIQLFFWFSDTCESIILKNQINLQKLWIFLEIAFAKFKFASLPILNKLRIDDFNVKSGEKWLKINMESDKAQLEMLCEGVT